MSKLITLKTFDSAIEAHLLRSRLEQEGIMSYIFDENIVMLNPLYNNLVGGIKLKIESNDEPEAQRILAELENRTLTRDDGTAVACPRCGSQHYYEGFKAVKSLGDIVSFCIAFLFMIYPFAYKSLKKCKDCGMEFK